MALFINKPTGRLTRTAYVLIVTASILAAVLAIIYTTMVAKNAAAAAAAGNAVAVVTPGRLGRADPSSYAVPEEVRHQHIALNWTVDFERQTIGGKATYTFQVQGNQAIKQILLDVHDIQIDAVAYRSADETWQPLSHFVSDAVEGIGAKLTIELPTVTTGELVLAIDYVTASRAAALQWLTPEQTLGKQHPYLFSQCQAIYARSLLPCQDTPAVKFTYTATVHHPAALTALLSAVRLAGSDGRTDYEQTVPIPSYLLAIAVGAIESRTLGPISKVWAEAAIVDAAAAEFSETPTMLRTACDICGPYVWKQYDLLVMPPSFPFGGMENPCLTFVTPTLLAGDKSLATVVAHEIAHSWTGNLVTNANFEHFWLNEGFTMFVEGKITGRLEGPAARDFQAIEGLSELREDVTNQMGDRPELTRLVVNLTGPISPEDAFSTVPYMKGQTFLRYLEDLLGGPAVFEPFLRHYLDKYKYQSIVTGDFQSTLYDYFRDTKDAELELVDWDLWLYSEGMPPVIPTYDTSLADAAHAHARLWSETGTLAEIAASPLLQQKLSVLQLIEFLSKLVEKPQIPVLDEAWVALLESTYSVGHTNGNAELRCRMVRLCVKARLVERIPEVLAFANSNFRMKFVRPVYRDLAAWPEAKPAAVANFERVRSQMMQVCSNQVAKDLGLAKV